MDCLYDKLHKQVQIIKTETTEDFIIKTLQCRLCSRSWKDFEGIKDVASPVISIQRQKSLPTGGQDNN